MPAFARPPHMPAQLHANLCGDTGCAESLLEALVDAFGTVSDPSQAKLAYDVWRRSVDRSSLGPLAQPSTLLGRLHFERAFIELLTLEIEQSHGVGLVNRGEVAEALYFAMGLPSSLSVSEAQTLYRLYIQPQAVYPEWAWFLIVDTSVDLDRDMATPSCLPWRLGLNRVTSGATYVGMVFAPNRIPMARAPVTPDVDFNYHEFWRPGGQTHVHPGTPPTCGVVGCSEVIAPPPTLGDLERRLKRVTAL